MLKNEKFIYITSLGFPARFANQIQVLSMARAFSQLLDNQFLFVCSGDENDDLTGIPHHAANPPIFRRLLSVYYYFLWIPFFLISHQLTRLQSILYFKDTRLATYALFWKKLFFHNIRIVIETHILFPLDDYVFPRADHIVTITSSMAEIIKNCHNIPPQKSSILLVPGTFSKNFTSTWIL